MNLSRSAPHVAPRWAALAALVVLCCVNPLLEGAEPAAADVEADAETEAAAQSSGEAAEEAEGDALYYYVYWFLAFGGSIVSLVFARRFFKEVMAADEGTDEMKEIAQYVRDGANTYLFQQYKIVAIFFLVIFLLLEAMVWFDLQSFLVPIAFLTGGFFSGLAGFFGMKTATYASNRTAAGAQQSLNQGLQVAFRAGAVMGLTVVGLGLLDITIWFAVLRWVLGLDLVEVTVTMLCFGMGASSQALFARVGGGIFTKAADVGADLVGKVEAGIPEDDKRNPATIADNVGDNVGDVAGMGADLYESYCSSILATAALGVAAFASGALVPEGGSVQSWQMAALFLPMVLAAVGIGLSIMGIYLVKTDEQADQKTLLKALARGVDISSIAIGLLAFPLAWLLLGSYWTVAFSVVIGLGAGWIIGKWTEYCTSDASAPTRNLADQALTGPATLIIGGIADGMKSVWVPVLTVGAATILAFGCATGFNFTDVNYFALGLYGVGIAAVGMLSTLGITLATDAYGPIADNAGGNAEMAGLDPIVRQRTDALDSLGNTTAATGKGFAIGSAALTALALLAAYVEEVRVGFERWGPSAMEELEGETGYYKINNQFVVHAVKDEDREQGEDYWQSVEGYLAMPTAISHRKVEEAWEDVDKKVKGPAPIPAEIVARVTDDDDGVTETQFVATGAALVPVTSATMSHWMAYYRCDVMNPKVLVGIFLGAMSVFVFCAMTMKAVGRAAFGMVEEVRRQFREKPGILAGTEKPDYKEPVRISTISAQKEMILPSCLGLLTPIVVGLLLGVAGVMGLLVGTLTCGFCMAVFMANAGGSWDNAKKYIEAGAHGGKGTDAHKAAVVGDTVGDPFKDTSGPSLNILIKLMSMVSVVAAGLIVRYSLTAWGIF